MQAPKPKLTKLDAAERQINTAIELLFHGGEPIAIHTLAMAAFRVLYDVSKRKNGNFHFNFDVMIRPGKEKEFRRYFNKWSNFAKHADSDPDRLIEALDESVNDFLLLGCCLGWQEHGNELSHAMHIFFSWFMTVYPDTLKDGSALKAKIVEEAPAEGLSRADLLDAGRRLLDGTPR